MEKFLDTPIHPPLGDIKVLTRWEKSVKERE
jgi:hypothetical protein